jgi:hypothetical protein
MSTPNLFDYATKELSQDAFITWLLQWADPRHQTADSQLHSCAQAFVRLLLKEEETFAINSMKSGRQWKNIDVWAEINDEILLAIEDKTHTGEHSSQLERYKADVETWCSDAERGKRWMGRFAYLKTGDEANGFAEDIRAKGWHTIGRPELVKFFKQHTEITNAIFNDFCEHLEKVEIMRDYLNQENYLNGMIISGKAFIVGSKHKTRFQAKSGFMSVIPQVDFGVM